MAAPSSLRTLNRRAGRNAQIGLLLLPGLAFFCLFTLYPIGKLLVMSFFDWKIGIGQTSAFVGLQNYRAVVGDATFRTALVNTLLYGLITVPGQMALGLWAAYGIHSLKKFQIPFRLVYYLPVITSWVIVSLVFKYLFNNEGILNYLLTDVLRLTGVPIRWLDKRWTGLAVAACLGIWKGVGWNMVVFLAALQGVPHEYYEASAIDGCNRWKQFWKITLPSIRGTVLFALVMLTIGAFNVYTSIKLITDGRPAHQTEVVLTWMYYQAFSARNMGYAAALSYIVAMIIAALAVLQFRFLGGEREGGRRL